jgi:hypothetical protein
MIPEHINSTMAPLIFREKLFKESEPLLQSIDLPAMFQMSIKFVPELQIIRIVTFGTVDRDAVSEMTTAAIAASKQYECKKCLIDHRNIELHMRLMDVYDLPRSNSELGVPSDARIALLHADDPETNGHFQYLEDLSVLQKINRHAFTDEQAAINWLTAD